MESVALDPVKDFGFSEREIARIKAAVQTWDSYGANADRRWLQPLIEVLAPEPKGEQNLRSSNLTDGGLRANREATVYLEESRDHDTIDELRALFWELWESSRVLTNETLKKFSVAHGQFKRADIDGFIESAVGKAPPPNIKVGSEKKASDLIFREQLFRQVYEQYRPSFNEVTSILNENHFRRPELVTAGAAQETNRFLNWVKLTYAVGEEGWDSDSTS